MKIVTQSKINIQKTDLYKADQVSLVEIKKSVLRAIQVLRDKNSTVGFAESCTGGLLSSSFAQVAGISDVFMGSLVTYANYVKADVLNVKLATLEKFGAVSAECAKEMSENVLMLLKVKYAVSVTGIAGPSGGSIEKPVGTVFISVSGIKDANEKNVGEATELELDTSTITTLIFHHDFAEFKTREDIQQAAVLAASENLQYFIKSIK